MKAQCVEQSVSKEETSQTLPPPYTKVVVITRNSFSFGFVDESGRWYSALTKRPIQDVIRWVG